MELLLGISGIIGIALLGITLTFPRERVSPTRWWRQRGDTSDCDPNSTLAITFEVLAEKLERLDIDCSVSHSR